MCVPNLRSPHHVHTRTRTYAQSNAPVASSLSVTKSANPDTAPYFLAQPDVPITGGVISLTLRPGDMWTLSTVGTMKKGAAPSPPPDTPFPAASYPDNFDACPISQEAAYWTDMSGEREELEEHTRREYM